MPATPFSQRKFQFIFTGCWLLWASLHAAVLHWFHFSIGAAIADSIISNGILALICLLLSTMFRFYLPRRDRYAYLLGLSVMLTITWFLISRFLLMLLQMEIEDYDHFFASSVPVRIAIGYLVIGSMTLLLVLWYTLNEQQENERRKTEAERLARDAELYNLRQQLQPHFLFNSLNSINALIALRPEQARTMIQQLSDFLRGTLKKENNQLVSLEEELNHLQLYLDIEMVRFGHRLNTMVDCNEACRQLKLPAMLLQPVVENAIKFGLYNTTEAVTISVHAQCANNLLMIDITNPFDPSVIPVKKGTGFGLKSVERRLFLLYAQMGLLKTVTHENLFTTTITIPQPI